MRTIVVAAILNGLLLTSAADESETIWLRKMVQLSGPSVQSAQLNLSATGSVAVYLNGQRLGRGLTSEGRRLQWDLLLARIGHYGFLR